MKLNPVVLLLTACYPVLAHLAVARASPALATASVACLMAGMLWPGLLRGSRLAWFAAACAGAALRRRC